MTDSPPRQITSSSLKVPRPERWKYPSGTPPKHDWTSSRPQWVGNRFGSVEIINDLVLYTRGSTFVEIRCDECGVSGWINFSNLKKGLTPGCRPCARDERRPYPRWLSDRMSVIQQRCENPNSPSYRHYGGRGVGFGFRSLREACEYVWRELGPVEQSMTLDRIDTNAGYEPGNLRFATQKQQQSNKRTTILTEFHQEHWPFGREAVTRKLKSGMTREQIIQEAKELVRTKGSHYNHVAAKLASMTSEMPDHIIVLPYRENSSTTAGTAATIASEQPSSPR